MSTFKAVIFDLDGTLLNTLDELASITNKVLEHNGFRAYPLDRYRYFVGDGAETMIRRAIGDVCPDPDVIKRCLAEFLEFYNANCGEGSRLYDGIKELLIELVHRGLKLAVLSNKPHDLTLKNVSLFLSDIPFDRVLGQREGVPKKPAPQAVNEIIDAFGINAQDCLYLGDTSVDMKTAVSAGVFPVGVLWGFRDKEELLEHGAKKLIEHPLDLLLLLNK